MAAGRPLLSVADGHGGDAGGPAPILGAFYAHRLTEGESDRQIRIATAAQYQWSEKLSVGGQFVYADYGKAEINNALLKGKYDRNDIFFFALNGNMKF